MDNQDMKDRVEKLMTRIDSLDQLLERIQKYLNELKDRP
jgi:chaperonin cofactor prefoldin